jgi:hypothetical protein
MAGFFAHGATLEFNGVLVAGMLDIPIPTQARDEVEITDHDSDFFREYVPGLIDNGTLDLTLRWVPGDPGQAALRANLGSRDPVEIVITGPPHMDPQETMTFEGFVQTLGGTMFWENTAAEVELSLRVTGEVEFGEVTS